MRHHRAGHPYGSDWVVAVTAAKKSMRPTKHDLDMVSDSLILLKEDFEEWVAHNSKGDAVYPRQRTLENGNQQVESFTMFAKRCMSELGRRFTVERISYKTATPKVIRRFCVDLDDKQGTALGEPPAAMFAVFFGISFGTATDWVKHRNPTMIQFLAEENEDGERKPDQVVRRRNSA